jgi:large subunit ribosomal protein L25
MDVPVVITGDAAGVKAGGKLSIKKRTLKIKGLADNLPDHLEVDVTELKIHHSVKVGDLAFDKIELLDPKIATIVTVSTSRVAVKTDEELAAEAAAAVAVEGAEAAAETPADEKGKDKEKGKEKEKKA